MSSRYLLRAVATTARGPIAAGTANTPTIDPIDQHRFAVRRRRVRAACAS